jgi:hypothetical protein
VLQRAEGENKFVRVVQSSGGPRGEYGHVPAGSRAHRPGWWLCVRESRVDLGRAEPSTLPPSKPG